MKNKDKKYLINILGWLGVVFVLLAYFLISFQLVNALSFSYLWLNVIGSGLIMITSWYKKDRQPAFLNLVWMAVALVSLARLIWFS